MEPSRKRITVVDDDTTFLSLMHDLLSSEGYDTTILREAGDAFEALRAAPPDLVILDIRMSSPEAGWTILDLMRLDRALADVPVIVCSADIVVLRAKEQHLRARRCFVLPKPFDISELLDLVNEAIGPPPGR